MVFSTTNVFKCISIFLCILFIPTIWYEHAECYLRFMGKVMQVASLIEHNLPQIFNQQYIYMQSLSICYPLPLKKKTIGKQLF